MILNRNQVRMVDRIAIDQFGISGVVLMENAGRGALELMRRVGLKGKVLIACGPGNNGGDGYVIARHILNQGLQCQVLMVADPKRLSGDAQTNFAILQKMNAEILRWPDCPPGDIEYDWVLDGLLGTGATGALRSPYDEAIKYLNQCRGKKLALDIPSGVDCDSGKIETEAFRAEQTATFVAKKPCMQIPSAKGWIGDVEVIDTGAPRQVIDLAIQSDKEG